MDEFIGILIIIAIMVFAAGPVAVILALLAFNKLGRLENRLKQLEAVGSAPPEKPQPPRPAAVPIPIQTSPIQTSPKAAPPVHMPQPAVSAPTAPIPVAQPVQPEKPMAPMPTMKPHPPLAAAVAAKPAAPAKPQTGLEQKIGITAALVVGVIVLIVGVGFFLKYVYENSMFSDLARVWLVAAGGAASLIVGEVIRRRDYGIVAKGLAALGFSLLYAAIFSASRVYHLIDLTPALVLALCVSAAAMAYAVCLNERFTAFLSLLGGYLSPLIIMYHQDLPVPVFSYILALSLGAMAAAMFRRWRAVNWIAMVGTWALFTVWFEQFYAPVGMKIPLIWLGIFGAVYLLQPLLYGLARKGGARAEDVGLVVINSIVVFYYLCRILYADHQQLLALAIAAFGGMHLLLMAAVLIRCRDDRRLIDVLAVLGTALLTTAIGVYFAEMPPKILGWAVETVVLTFIGIRYKSLTAQVMSFLVAGVSVAGLFYHLPLHGQAPFRLIVNGPFATWLFVVAALLVCHALWRFMPGVKKEEKDSAAQAFYVIPVLLLALGCILEWFAFCDVTIENSVRMHAQFFKGLLVIASVLQVLLATRPLCPKGLLVRTVAAIIAVVGSVFTAMVSFGLYSSAFTIFVNAPFVLCGLFVASILWAAWQVRRDPDVTEFFKQLPDTLLTLALLLLGILISEQVHLYWYCRNEFIKPVADWRLLATQYLVITWTVYGLAMLAGGIVFKKTFIKALGIIAALLATGTVACQMLPLHENGDFHFVWNLPFIAWTTAAVGLLIGHGLWRFLPQSTDGERTHAAQIYYLGGILLAGLGGLLEWYAHCHWQIKPAEVGNTWLLCGSIVLFAVVLLTCFVRALPPAGNLVRGVGLCVGLGGAVLTVYAAEEVYYRAFRIFANGPFVIMMLYAAAMLAAAACLRSRRPSRWRGPAVIVVAALVLVWSLLSQQIYQYYYYQNVGDSGYAVAGDWRFAAQMVISLAWAIYAAILLLIGFIKRAAGVRYLSLTIFTVLLGKINWDIQELPTEYRIATFVTTGLILVGVSFLYQFLRKKGFFETPPQNTLKPESPHETRDRLKTEHSLP